MSFLPFVFGIHKTHVKETGPILDLVRAETAGTASTRRSCLRFTGTHLWRFLPRMVLSLVRGVKTERWKEHQISRMNCEDATAPQHFAIVHSASILINIYVL